ncbi:hypothetical protein GCM10012285_33600 [Streptomyces kronopolitis]|uniref:Uncharacterized protein n=1 Tax=Streptomyces kronopolitis TaxID=1612435 RepID=A0ABQ2JJF4_9ACTN|nr:hypothetical protein [Streptomyces kronopolitis]GGN47646.1 hypothetical protein GCM10012285_33600 [Streptomyces kronopolitis]
MNHTHHPHPSTNTPAPGERDYPLAEPDLAEEQNARLTEALRGVRDGAAAPGALRELAGKVLGGRLALKDVLDDPSGYRVLTDGISGMRESWRSMSPQDRQAVRATVEERADEAEAGGGRPR